MPSNHTENYSLSQWEPEDAVLRADFNADNAKIDEALAAKAEQSELDSLSATVSSLSGTVAGHTSSLNSQSSSLAARGNCQIYTTTYTGDGASSKSLSFSGYPVFVFVQPVGYPGHIMFIRNGECSAGDNVWSTPTWSSRSLSWTTEDRGVNTMNSAGSKYAVFALLNMSM